jgi:hypothetical protein
MFISGETKGREKSISYSCDVPSKIDEGDKVSVVWILHLLCCIWGEREKRESEGRKA